MRKLKSCATCVGQKALSLSSFISLSSLFASSFPLHCLHKSLRRQANSSIPGRLACSHAYAHIYLAVERKDPISYKTPSHKGREFNIEVQRIFFLFSLISSMLTRGAENSFAHKKDRCRRGERRGGEIGDRWLKKEKEREKKNENNLGNAFQP